MFQEKSARRSLSLCSAGIVVWNKPFHHGHLCELPRRSEIKVTYNFKGDESYIIYTHIINSIEKLMSHSLKSNFNQ